MIIPKSSLTKAMHFHVVVLMRQVKEKAWFCCRNFCKSNTSNILGEGALKSKQKIVSQLQKAKVNANPVDILCQGFTKVGSHLELQLGFPWSVYRLWYLMSLLIQSYGVLWLVAKNMRFYQVQSLMIYNIHTTYLKCVGKKKHVISNNNSH